MTSNSRDSLIKYGLGIGWIFLFLLINGAFHSQIMNFYDAHIKHHPTPEEIHQADLEKKAQRQERIQQAVKYAASFWADHQNTPIIGKVIDSNGKEITGRIQFIPDCPHGVWCAQPDGTVTDDNGSNPLTDEHDAAMEDEREPPDGP